VLFLEIVRNRSCKEIFGMNDGGMREIELERKRGGDANDNLAGKYRLAVSYK
jgi:hypothetical protein